MIVPKFILTKLIVQINQMDNSSNTILLLATCILIFFSCQQEKKSDNDNSTTQSLTITDAGIKTLALEDGVNFEGLKALKLTTINDQEYISFYDRITHSIYLYDYQTDDLFKKISMEKYGPNAVKEVSRFFFHSLDSIFVDSSMGIYLSNSKGEVLTKKSKGTKLHNGITLITSDSKFYRFNQDSRFNDGHIEMVISQMRGDNKNNEYAIFNFEKDSIIKEFVQTEEIINNFDEIQKVREEAKKRREWNSNIMRFFSRNKNHLYSSTSISDSLYVFNEGELIKTIYAGVPDIDVASYSDYIKIDIVERFEGGMTLHKNPKQPAFYKNMLMSPDGKLIYRFLYHGAKPKFVDGSERAVPNPLGTTLIIIDTETEELSYHELPIEEIDIDYNLFVSNEGIYFRIKDQQNEDQVQFRFFKVTQ